MKAFNMDMAFNIGKFINLVFFKFLSQIEISPEIPVLLRN